MSDDEARARLGRAQADLVAALVTGGTTPAGLDTEQVRATRTALLVKRADAAARVWPALACLPGFQRRFQAFTTGREPGGAWADGLAFARSVRDDLDDDGRTELLVALVAGRRLAVRRDLRPGARRILVLRAPVLGTRVVTWAPTGRGRSPRSAR